MTKPVTPTMHGIADYFLAVALVFAPEIFGFSEGGAAVTVARTAGVIVFLQNLATDYPLGLFRGMSMQTHLASDYVIGLILICSPFLFGFFGESANFWLPHIVAGALIVGMAALTESYVRYTPPNRAVRH